MSRLLTIDGKTASGKTTVALRMAELLSFTMFSAGHHLRAFALAALNHKYIIIRQDGTAECVDREGCVRLVDTVRIITNGRDRWWLDGNPVTDQLHTPAVTESVAIVAEMPEVRDWHDAEMLQYARDRRDAVVFEGRVTGHSFPGAVHIWLHVSPEVAAARITAGRAEGVLESSHRRNARDAARKVAPVIPVADATTIDTDPLDEDDVFDRVRAVYEQALASAV